MKQIFTFLGIIAMGAIAYGQADTDIVNIPDTLFKNRLLTHHYIDINGDGEISYGEAKNYRGTITLYDGGAVKSLVGIEAFVNIVGLDCYRNDLTSLDLSKNTALVSLRCGGGNKISSLDLSKNTALKFLQCSSNPLTSLDLSNNVLLQELDISNTKISRIDLSRNTQLKKLDASWSYNLNYLDLSQNLELEDLNIGRTRVSNIDLSKNINLKKLHLGETALRSLDLTHNSNLEYLYCSESYGLSYLNLANGNNSKLKQMRAEDTNLHCIIIDAGFIPSYDWSKDERAKYKYYSCDDVYVHIPDANFKKLLVDNKTINIDEDNEISYNEAKAYKGSISVYSHYNISDLTGLEAFINITELSIEQNTQLKNLDISNNTKLTRLNISNTQLTNLDISKNTVLQYLSCNNNQLVKLDLSNNLALISLECNNNQLTNLDVSKNTLLTKVYCEGNKLIQLDISKNILLTHLACSDNQLTRLDTSENKALVHLYCNNNDLNSIEVNKSIELSNLSVSGNALTKIELDKLDKLEKLDISFNSIKEIDLIKNINITYLSMERNQLGKINVDNLKELYTLNLSGNSLSDDMLILNNNSKLRYIDIEDTQLEIIKFKNYTHYTNRDISIGNQVKCIEVDNPNRSRAWNIVWQNGYENNYQADCSQYLSTQENILTTDIKVLNPVKDNLVIKTTAKVEKVEIYNTAGQLVKVLFKGNTQVQDLAKGIYLIKITTDQGAITEKIIKQ